MILHFGKGSEKTH